MKVLRRTAILFLLLLGTVSLACAQDSRYVESYTRFVPVALDMGLGLVGVNAENAFFSRGVEAGATYVSVCILTDGLLKNVVSSRRPDGSGTDSFPSGHTAVAFAGAELVRLEYGWGWGAGAYAVAASVGAMRLKHDRHWPKDVIAGAGIGILSANIGRWTMPGIKRILRLERLESAFDAHFSISPVYDPRGKSFGGQFAINW